MVEYVGHNAELEKTMRVLPWIAIASVSFILGCMPEEPPAADSDGDGIPDSTDAFPNDPSEAIDTDGDGIGDVADSDDDGDGIPDTQDSDNTPSEDGSYVLIWDENSMDGTAQWK